MINPRWEISAGTVCEFNLIFHFNLHRPRWEISAGTVCEKKLSLPCHPGKPRWEISAGTVCDRMELVGFGIPSPGGKSVPALFVSFGIVLTCILSQVGNLFVY